MPQVSLHFPRPRALPDHLLNEPNGGKEPFLTAKKYAKLTKVRCFALEGKPLVTAEFLEAADGYVPLLQSLVWPLFLVFVGLYFRKQVADIFTVLKKRIESGAELKIAGLEVGKLVTKTSDLPDDVKTFGDPDQLKLLFKAQGKGWKKSTKALEVPNGCIVQVTTERQSADGDWANAEAVVFVPNVRLEKMDETAFRIIDR